MRVAARIALTCATLLIGCTDDGTQRHKDAPRDVAVENLEPPNVPNGLQPSTETEPCPPLSEAEARRQRNEAILARVAQEEGAPKESRGLESVSAVNAEAASQPSATPDDPPSSPIDLSNYENQLSDLAREYRDSTRLARRAQDECAPKRVETTGTARDPQTGRWETTTQSGYVEGSAAACAEEVELNARLQVILQTYDRLYNDYTLKAMRHGKLLKAKRRELRIPKRR